MHSFLSSFFCIEILESSCRETSRRLLQPAATNTQCSPFSIKPLFLCTAHLKRGANVTFDNPVLLRSAHYHLCRSRPRGGSHGRRARTIHLFLQHHRCNGCNNSFRDRERSKQLVANRSSQVSAFSPSVRRSIEKTVKYAVKSLSKQTDSVSSSRTGVFNLFYFKVQFFILVNGLGPI